jgi:beta-phosphoglucomutase-like phosphatase (HAD superfamily)
MTYLLGARRSLDASQSTLPQPPARALAELAREQQLKLALLSTRERRIAEAALAQLERDDATQNCLANLGCGALAATRSEGSPQQRAARAKDDRPGCAPS